MSIDAHAFKKWDPKTQEAALAMLKDRETNTFKPFFCPNPKCSGDPHNNDDGWDFFHARLDQRPPPWAADYLTDLILSGRGTGKTLSSAHIAHQVVKKVPRIAIIGPTGPALREMMIEGPTGIQATAKPGEMPTWHPSRRVVIWPNGAVAQCFSAEEPDRLRSGNFHWAWLDEAAFMDKIDEVWMNLLMALREGEHPHVRVTTTPLPTKWIKELAKDPATRVTRVSTYANLHNLSPVFKARVVDKFEGTRQGQQELYGEILDDMPGALWKRSMFKYISEAPAMSSVVVAVDPAGSANKKSDETGIIVVGISGYGNDFTVTVLADHSGKYSPKGWATEAMQLRERYHASAIIAEKNYGGDMVRHTLKSVDEQAPVILVDSRKGKDVRATPIVGLYEQGKVQHLSGPDRADLMELEDEQTTWVPGESPSPNRVDALVHGVTHLTKHRGWGKITVPGRSRKPEREETERPLPQRVGSITQAARTTTAPTRRSTVAWPRSR